MREIKFRGKRKSSRKDFQKWIYGSLYIDNKDSFINYRLENGDIETEDVIRNTIGQFTGLHDKNGVEIYEGDIVKFDYEWTKSTEIGVITWNNENASFQIKGHIPSSSMKHLNRMKVIGNIYENEVD